MTPRWRSLAVAALISAALLAAGCTPATSGSSSSSSSPSSRPPLPPPPRATLTVQPADTTLDQPLRFVITGLRPGNQITLVIEADDGAGHLWRSETNLSADDTGRIDTATTFADLGGYSRADATGPLTAMQPLDVIPEQHRWRAVYRGRYTAQVRWNDIVLARAAFTHRPVTPPLGTLTVARDGFAAGWMLPPRPVPGTKLPAVLYIGGSEGGLPHPLLLSTLANRGVAVLGVGYFAAPGLPRDLASIPIEYFAKALTWLASRPEVDPRRITVVGTSRGSEAAQLLALAQPSAIRGLVLTVPSHVTRCSHPDNTRPAWTVAGRPRHCDPELGWGSAVDPRDRDAIAIERFPGPVLAVCGARDHVLPGCAMVDAITTRRRGLSTMVRKDEHGGHGSGWLLPYLPTSGVDDEKWPVNGDEPGANARARAAFWPVIVAFVTAP